MSIRTEEIILNIIYAITFAFIIVFGIALLVGSHIREKAAEDVMNAARYERVYLAGGAR